MTTTEKTTAALVPAAQRPFVVVHAAVSLDGAIEGFPADIGRFYQLVPTWHEDVTLVGADTVLAQEDALREGDQPGPARDGPLLVVVDSRARVSEWDGLRRAGYWSDVVALRAEGTPEHAKDVREVVTGIDRVDLAAALEILADRGAQVVRVDSGGALIGALLRGGLLDEVSAC
jgi:2,5-diamino-6-(ribosylamino)-4(3H)-pyrimidinone 5'-phosphate reductase